MNNINPYVKSSIATLDVQTKLMQDAQQQLAQIMGNCPYYDQETFNKAGKTRSILDNTLTRLEDIKKDIRLLEIVKKDGMDTNEYLGEKKSIMNDCLNIKNTVERHWDEVQRLCEKFSHYEDEPEEPGDDLVETYNNEIAS